MLHTDQHDRTIEATRDTIEGTVYLRARAPRTEPTALAEDVTVALGPLEARELGMHLIALADIPPNRIETP